MFWITQLILLLGYSYLYTGRTTEHCHRALPLAAWNPRPIEHSVDLPISESCDLLIYIVVKLHGKGFILAWIMEDLGTSLYNIDILVCTKCTIVCMYVLFS